MSGPLAIERGQVELYRLFDVAQEARLTDVERALRTHPNRTIEGASAVRLRLVRQRNAVAFSDPPVIARLADRTLELEGHERSVQVYAKAYDFGVMTILWIVPIEPGTSLDSLRLLSVALEEPALQDRLGAWMRDDADVAVEAMRAGLVRPRIDDAVETLTIYTVTRFTDPAVKAHEISNDPALTGLLLGEEVEFSAQLRAETQKALFSYSEHDLAVVGFDQAFVYDRDGTTDVAVLLEFALAQVLELAYHDRLLDRRLSEMHDRLDGGRGKVDYEELRRKLLSDHLEITEVLEQVTAAVKVTEDFYYAQIYRAAMRVFRVDELVEATHRKLDLIYRTYSMLSDEVETRTSRRLEWTVIVLILIEVVLGIADRIIR